MSVRNVCIQCAQTIKSFHSVHFLSRYVRYRQKPMSITDILSLTLSFVRDEGTWEHEEGKGPRGEEQGAEKRARTSLHPSPRYKSESELHTLEQCLTRWAQELAQDIEGIYVHM